MRIPAKYVFFISFIIFMTYYFLQIVNVQENVQYIDPNLKYILIWTDPLYPPIKSLGKGQETFLKLQCPEHNCYVTGNRIYLNKLTDFHVLLFHGPELERYHVSWPKQRAPHQQYVFASRESSHYYPLARKKYDNFFNWTWTYKLNSDLYYGYIIVRNKQGAVIGPKENMLWLDIEEMKPIDAALKEELSHKRMAVAWIVSNCVTPGKRERYAIELRYELAKYNLTLDVYGQCGKKSCPKDGDNSCYMLIKRLYYFYLSFENSFSEDYVTEKLLTALWNNAVPIVYGAADYTRFLPDGAYLDALQLGVETLVERMVDAIKDKETYYDFFKWRNHYTYHNVVDSVETNYYCKFCSKVNGKVEMESEGARSVDYKHFRHWWNSRLSIKLAEDQSLLSHA